MEQRSDDRPDFGLLVKRLRRRLDWTQEELAHRIEISPRHLSNIELGKARTPGRLTIERLADAFGLEGPERTGFRAAVPVRTHVRRRPAGPVHDETPPADDRRHHLPAGTRPPRPVGRLIGREAELARAIAAALDVPLLTITGPPGVGKTRFALELAQAPAVVAAFEAVGFVPLATARTAADAVGAVNSALGIAVTAPPDPELVLSTFLASHRVLLILDNMEQLPDADRLLTRLLASSPAAHIVCTSQRLPPTGCGETVSLPPLSLAPPTPVTSPTEALRSSPAVAFLLDQRARLGLAQPSDHELRDLAEVGRLLDGLPLAMELAAARLRTLSAAQLVDHLRGRPASALRSGDSGDDRQRNLLAAIGWSIDLLRPETRRALALLSTFQGGFDLEATVTVLTAGEGDRPTEATTAAAEAARPVPMWALDRLDELLSVHLLVADHQTGPERPAPRYQILETIREAGELRLFDSGLLDTARRAHARWFTGRALILERSLLGAEALAALAEIQRELPNIRAALGYLLEAADAGDPESVTLALRLSSLLWQYWRTRGLSDEGERLMSRAIELADRDLSGGPSPDYARTVNNLAILVMDAGDVIRARALFETALAHYRAIGDHRGVSDAINNLGVIAVSVGDYITAVGHHRAAHDARITLGDEHRIIMSLQNLGDLALDLGLQDLTLEFHHEVLRRAEALGDGTAAAYAHLAIGETRSDAGEFRRGRRSLDRAQALFAAADDQLGLGFVANDYGWLTLAQGRHQEAIVWQQRCLRFWQRCNNRRGQALAIEALALALIGQGRTGPARRLLVGVHAVRRRESMGRPPKRTPAVEAALHGLIGRDLGHDLAEAELPLSEAVIISLGLATSARRGRGRIRARPRIAPAHGRSLPLTG